MTDSLGSRLQVELNEMQEMQIDKSEPPSKNRFHVWVERYGNTLKQKEIQFDGNPEIGYSNTMEGTTLGCDVNFAKVFYLGVLGAFTDSLLQWEDNRGSGSIRIGYAGTSICLP